MKYRWEKKYLYWGLTAFLVIVLSISFFILMYNFRSIYVVTQNIIQILMPFIVGGVIAYLLCPVMNFFEIKCFTPLLKKMKLKKVDKSPRIISIIVTVMLAIALVTGLLFMVIPQLVESINGIIKNFQTYSTNFEKWATSLVSSNPELQKILSEEFDNVGGVATDWAKKNLLPEINNILSGLTNGVIDVFNFLKNIFVGIIISIYVLYSKEKFGAQAKKLLYAIFPIKGANRIITVTKRSHVVFGGFIVGKLIDSLVVGILCFTGMTIFHMPFPLLISVIISITNIIPFFGPFIGAIPSALLVLMIDPLTCLYFILFILVLQQIDGNIIDPKISGGSTGLTAFWVIFAILISGGLFGFIGMVIGVPAFAVIYSLIVEFLENRLKKHEMPVSTKTYYMLESIDILDNQPVYDDIDMKIVREEKKAEKK